jgi:hypothetical protein
MAQLCPMHRQCWCGCCCRCCCMCCCCRCCCTCCCSQRSFTAASVANRTHVAQRRSYAPPPFHAFVPGMVTLVFGRVSRHTMPPLSTATKYYKGVTLLEINWGTRLTKRGTSILHSPSLHALAGWSRPKHAQAGPCPAPNSPVWLGRFSTSRHWQPSTARHSTAQPGYGTTWIRHGAAGCCMPRRQSTSRCSHWSRKTVWRRTSQPPPHSVGTVAADSMGTVTVHGKAQRRTCRPPRRVGLGERQHCCSI